MSHVSGLGLSRLVREQLARPSPIRQIMKMVERQNMVAMGLKPEDVISFASSRWPVAGGQWPVAGKNLRDFVIFVATVQL